MNSTFSLLDSTQNTINPTAYPQLLAKAEEQYRIVAQIFWLYQKTLDFDFYDMYMSQLTRYQSQMRQIRLANPELVKLKCQEVLAEANKLWADHTLQWVAKTGTDGSQVLEEQGLTPEVVGRHVLLLDTAQALGWKPSLPELQLPPAGLNIIDNAALYKAQEAARCTGKLLDSRGWCLWKCAVLENDVIAVIRDEQVKGVPQGYPIYTEDELEEIFSNGASEATIKLIHEAKKLTGAVVMNISSK